jgi:hypothetical protein
MLLYLSRGDAGKRVRVCHVATIHSIVITLLHMTHLIMEALLLSSPLSDLLQDHVRYIVQSVIHRPLRWVKQRLKSGLLCLQLDRY